MAAIDTSTLACTLELHEMAPRLERLRRLADTSLQSHQLDANVLRLTYRPGAAGEVKALVDLERGCCRFLDFRLQESAATVVLTITAPKGAGAAAQSLFAQFVPSTAQAPERPCCTTCG